MLQPRRLPRIKEPPTPGGISRRVPAGSLLRSTEMSRSMKFGIATIVAAFVFSLVGAEDAEARHRRHRRNRCGCHGYSSHCAPAPSCCGVVQACPGGVCGVTNGAHSAGYGATNGQSQNQPTLPPAPAATDQAAPPPPTTNGAAPAPGAPSSPSDRPAPAPNGASAPPPPPQQ